MVPIEQLRSEPVDRHRDDFAEMVAWMGEIDRICQLRAGGWTDEDFDRLRRSTTRAHRQLGETEFRLFRDDERGLKAGYDGRSLIVENGHHRLEAARAAHVKEVPVRVWATERSHLELAARFREPRLERTHEQRERSWRGNGT